MAFSVPHPLPYPNYVLEGDPTPERLRQQAIDAMEDFLSIQWSTHKKIVHGKSGPVGGKIFIYDADVVFAGLPYTNGDKGLIQFLEFYDHKTGRLRFDGTGQEFNRVLGGTCAAGVMWSWSTVCHSLTGQFDNYFMVPQYGCYPVGNITFDDTIRYYPQCPTRDIIRDNGIECVLDAYSKILPADAVTTSPHGDHTMMVIEKPHVEYREDGSIDPEKSYVIIRDQRGGFGDGFYDAREADCLIHYSGRLALKYSFQRLLDEAYIPLTTAEFMGKEPYERAKVWYDGEKPADMTQLKLLDICSNYPMAVLKVILTDEEGGETLIDRHLFVKKEVETGLARCFPMRSMADTIPAAAFVAMEPGRTYDLRVEVTATNGEKLVPVRLSVTK